MSSKEARSFWSLHSLRVGIACGAVSLASVAVAQSTQGVKLPGSPLRPAAGAPNPNNPAATRPSTKAAAEETAAALKLKDLNGVMAVVNSEQITTRQLGQECMRRYGEEVLESLVNRQLIVQACQKSGIEI